MVTLCSSVLVRTPSQPRNDCTATRQQEGKQAQSPYITTHVLTGPDTLRSSGVPRTTEKAETLLRLYLYIYCMCVWCVPFWAGGRSTSGSWRPPTHTSDRHRVIVKAQRTRNMQGDPLSRFRQSGVYYLANTPHLHYLSMCMYVVCIYIYIVSMHVGFCVAFL
jgi:hypothetical protein